MKTYWLALSLATPILVLAQTAPAQDQAAMDAQVRSLREAELKLQTTQMMAAERARQAEADRLKKIEAQKEEERQLEMESRRIDLEVKRARAKRANDFIDRELKREDAQTDVIQADADVKRNVSSGTKSYLEGAGKGVEAAGKRATVPNNLTIHNKIIEKY